MLPIEDVAKGGSRIKEQHQVVITDGFGVFGEKRAPIEINSDLVARLPHREDFESAIGCRVMNCVFLGFLDCDAMHDLFEDCGRLSRIFENIGHDRRLNFVFRDLGGIFRAAGGIYEIADIVLRNENVQMSAFAVDSGLNVQIGDLPHFFARPPQGPSEDRDSEGGDSRPSLWRTLIQQFYARDYDAFANGAVIIIGVFLIAVTAAAYSARRDQQ